MLRVCHLLNVGKQVCNVVAFVSDRSKPKDQRKFDGPWVSKPVSVEELLDDFNGWHDHPRDLLEVGM